MPKNRIHHSPRAGGEAKKDRPAVEPPTKPARNRSWTPGQKGQGGEGHSKGYGGGHQGTGPSGPEDK